MENMFNGCEMLTSLDISNFDTSNVVNMYGMFCSDFNLRKLNLSNFKTKKVENMDFIFNNNMMMSSLDIRNFDTINVDSKRNFFNGVPSKGKIFLNFDKISNGILKQLPKGWEIIEI